MFRVSANQLRAAATVGALTLTFWAVMPQLMTTLFLTLHPVAAFVFAPDTSAFRRLFHTLVSAGFFCSLMLVAAIYRRLINALTGARRSSLDENST